MTDHDIGIGDSYCRIGKPVSREEVEVHPMVLAAPNSFRVFVICNTDKFECPCTRHHYGPELAMNVHVLGYELPNDPPRDWEAEAAEWHAEEIANATDRKKA